MSVLSFGEIIEFAFVIMASVKKTEQTSVAETQVESISSPHEPELAEKIQTLEKDSKQYTSNFLNNFYDMSNFFILNSEFGIHIKLI